MLKRLDKLKNKIHHLNQSLKNKTSGADSVESSSELYCDNITFLDQIYCINEKPALIRFEATDKEVEDVIKRFKDIHEIKELIDKKGINIKNLKKKFDRIYSKICSIRYEAYDRSEISEKLTYDIFSFISSNIIDLLLSNCINHYMKENEENKELYGELIEKIKNYLEKLNIYTFRCPENAGFGNEGISVYFSEKSRIQITEDERLLGRITKILEPPLIIKYFDRYGKEEVLINEGKCQYYSEV